MKLQEANTNSIRETGYAIICLSTESFVYDEASGAIVFANMEDAARLKKEKETAFPGTKFEIRKLALNIHIGGF